jgi:hypothetical protein
VIRKALLAYAALVEMAEEGGKFYMRQPGSDSYRAVEFPIDVERKPAPPAEPDRGEADQPGAPAGP